jgi:hypothetical protein
VRGDNLVFKNVVLEDVCFLGRVDDLFLEIFRFQVPRLPLGRIAIVGKGIDPALSVGLSTRILIPVPGPTQGAALFDGYDVLKMELVVEEVDESYAAKSSTDDDESVDFFNIK